ncbi:MAG: helix-turn-helix domain-containing protein [Verrucomicrobia bacterium]|nr:helix-turn-helix domain-containing protein [Verrucomicrobiota bacterium]
MRKPQNKIDPANEKPLADLHFPGRTTLYVHEVARALGVCDQTVLNLLDTGELIGINIGTGNKKFRRIPVHEYEKFLTKRSSLNLGT